MKPILFLDVDGVLNCSDTRELSCMGSTGVDPVKAALLARVVTQADAEIVLSSTWRKYPQLALELWRKLGREMKERCIGVTPLLDNREPSGLFSAKSRGDEIAAWLTAHPERNRFVILDDDGDMGPLLPHLVRTSFFSGLTEELADELINRLAAA